MTDHAEAAGTAIAAFALAQIAVWQLDPVAREKAIVGIRNVIDACREPGIGFANNIAARKLQTVLDMLEKDGGQTQ